MSVEKACELLIVHLRRPARSAQGDVVKRRSGLFWDICLESGWLRNGTWTDEPVERKMTKEELREAYRLWVVHRDIREGEVKP